MLSVYNYSQPRPSNPETAFQHPQSHHSHITSVPVVSLHYGAHWCCGLLQHRVDSWIFPRCAEHTQAVWKFKIWVHAPWQRCRSAGQLERRSTRAAEAWGALPLPDVWRASVLPGGLGGWLIGRHRRLRPSARREQPDWHQQTVLQGRHRPGDARSEGDGNVSEYSPHHRWWQHGCPQTWRILVDIPSGYHWPWGGQLPGMASKADDCPRQSLQKKSLELQQRSHGCPAEVFPSSQ